MELFEQELAEVLADEGVRYVLRRHPVRAQEVRDNRQAKLATLQALVAQHNHYLTEHPRADAQGAVQKLVARATTLRLSDWVELTLEERAVTLTVNASAQQEAAKLDGCYVLKTDLTPQQAKKELVHDRYKDLASVEHALMLAYQIIRYLASCWNAFDVTVAEGLHALTTLCLVEVAPQHAPSYHSIPTPRDAIAHLLHNADIKLPKAFVLSGTRVSTKKKLQSEQLVL